MIVVISLLGPFALSFPKAEEKTFFMFFPDGRGVWQVLPPVTTKFLLYVNRR